MSNEQSERQSTLGEYRPQGAPPDTFYDPEKGWVCSCGSERKRCKHVLMAMWAQRNVGAQPGVAERLETARGIAEEVLQRMAEEHEEDVGVLLTVLLTAAAASPDGIVTTDAIWDTLGEDWNKDPDGTVRVSAKINGSVVREATKGTGWFEKGNYVNSHRATCHGRPVLQLKLTEAGRKQVTGRGN
ncbi:MAG: hypothetical protein KGJ23_08605 [Euryarchaeota archaeon]|nr:hypothetical protein [Euryarchaeota archaeon]